MPTEEQIRVPVGDGSITAIKTVPDERKSEIAFVYAPGAGSNVNDAFATYCSRRVAEAGVEAWRFQFLYQERKRPAPDRPPVLESTWRAVLDEAQRTSSNVVLGGRSMGGRIASQVVAKGAPAFGLALFAYPLHPTGRPHQTRDEHLPSIQVPTLFCSGTRDTFASPKELQAAAALVPQAQVHFLEGADHGFTVLKSSGRTREDVFAEATETLLEFLGSLS